MKATPGRHCPACRTRDSAFAWVLGDRLLQTTEESFNYRLCRQCRSMFIDPLPESNQFFKHYPPGYWWDEKAAPSTLLQQVAGAYRNWVVRDHLRFLARARQQGESRSLRLLDVGCGSGAFLRAAACRGYMVTGLDTSQEAVDILHSHGLEGIHGSLSNNALGDRKFDILTLFHVLEHVEDPGRELRHGLQYLQPGGHVIVQVPNFGSLQAAWFRSRWYGLDPPRHLTQFSPAGLRVLLESADLSIVSVYYFSLRDNAPAFVSSLFPGLDPIARRVRQQKVMLTNSGIEESLSLLTYMLLVFFVTPLALMESLARKGATLVVHARKPAD